MLTIITPIYKSAKLLEKFLHAMNNQIDNDFKLLLIIDTTIDDTLKVVDDFKSKKINMDLIFHSKRIGKIDTIKSVIKSIETKYILITSVSIDINEKFTQKLNNLIRYGAADIIEFNAQTKDPFKTKGKIRLEFKKPVNIENHPEIIAYSYPYYFNKIIKTSLFNSISRTKTQNMINSMFEIEHVYKILFEAKTYISHNLNVFNKTQTSTDFIESPSEIIDQWKSISQYAEQKFNDLYINELQYANYYYVAVIISALVHKINNKKVSLKFETKLAQIIKRKFANFFNNNIYAIKNCDEASVLLKNKDIKHFYKNQKDLQSCM